MSASSNRRQRRFRFLVVLASLTLLTSTVRVGWDHVLFRWRFEPRGVNDWGYREYEHRQTGLVFVRLPAGRFVMGTPGPERAVASRFRLFGWQYAASEQPAHAVRVSSFLIAKYEVSSEAWTRVLELVVAPDDSATAPLEPIRSIYYDDCVEFCEATNLDLPTEAQWEYACRAGTSTPFSFGDTLDHAQAAFSDHAIGTTAIVSVDSKQANGFGLYNMHGNVAEWCRDVFDAEFYHKPESRVPDPVCTSGSNEHVIRGGCATDEAWACRSASRDGYARPEQTRLVGLRPVYPAP